MAKEVKHICDHVNAECIRDRCHHAKPHKLEIGIGQCCQQGRCNGTREGPKENIKVKCIEAKDDK